MRAPAQWCGNPDPATSLPDQPTLFSSLPPRLQVYDGMVVTGTGGAEYPIRGFVQAFDAETGKVIWQFPHYGGAGRAGQAATAGAADSWKTGRRFGVEQPRLRSCAGHD